MDLYQSIAFVFLVVVGLGMIRDQLKRDKIDNVWFYLGIIGGLFLAYLFFVLGLLGYEKLISTQQFINWNINFFIASLGGFLLWKNRILNIAIVRCVIIYAALIPITFLQSSYISFLPLLVFLLNFCLIALVYFLGEFIYFWLRVLFSADYRKTINWGPMRSGKHKTFKDKILNSTFLITGLLVISVIMQDLRILIIDKFKNSSDILALLLIGMFFARQKIRKHITAKNFHLVVVFLGLLLFYASLNLQHLKNFTFEMTVFFIVTIAAQQLLFLRIMRVFMLNAWRKIVPFKDFSSSMVPTDPFWQRLMENAVADEKESLKEIRRKGYDSEDFDFIKKVAHGIGMQDVGVQKKFPFTVWMFLGALVTIFVRGPILDMLIFISK